MALPLVPTRHRNPNAFSRERDARILWLLERHPATAAMLTEIGLFTSKTRAAKRLRRLLKKKKLRLAGTVSLKDGRPQHAYCRLSWVKSDNLLHEVQISRLCFKLHADEIRRGPREIDPFLRPDAELRIGGRRFLLEFDTGTMGIRAIVQTRFAKYRDCEDLVLWVCVNAARKEALRKHAGAIRGIALFTTLDEALRDPHDMIWVDTDGERASLPRGIPASPYGGHKG